MWLDKKLVCNVLCFVVVLYVCVEFLCKRLVIWVLGKVGFVFNGIEVLKLIIVVDV